jgi:D-alanine-D-alanine ligase
MASSFPSVLILHNDPAKICGPCAESEAGVLDQVQAVATALEALGIPCRSAPLQALDQLPETLERASEPLVFNLVETLAGSAAAANRVPSVVRAFGKACTGNDSPCLDLTLDKARAKAVLREFGLPVPAGCVVPPGAIPEATRLPAGPLIAKPVATDASEGIEAASVFPAGYGPDLLHRVADLHRRFGQAVLIEELVGTRELNVALFADGDEVRVLPVAEIDFVAFPADKPRIVDYAAKWLPDSFEYTHTPRLLPAPLSDELAAQVRHLARQAWHAAGCRGYARVDFRLGADGALHVLEINANPDISPDAGFAAALAAAGVSYADFVRALLADALHDHPALAPATVAAAPAAATAELAVRPTVPADRERIVALLQDTGFFRPSELTVAREVLDDGLEGRDPDYLSLTAILDGNPVGWVSYGPVPGTVGTYDIYWLAVDRQVQGKGIGRRLLAAAETDIRAHGGLRAVIETAGQSLYGGTRSFYLKAGYTEAARLTDFYDAGDDKVVYLRDLSGR